METVSKGHSFCSGAPPTASLGVRRPKQAKTHDSKLYDIQSSRFMEDSDKSKMACRKEIVEVMLVNVTVNCSTLDRLNILTIILWSVRKKDTAEIS